MHAELLAHLLPPVAYNPRGVNIGPELTAEGLSLDAVQGRAESLIDEADVRTAADLLADWERVAGLPDTCVFTPTVEPTPGQRRDAVVGKLTSQGGQRAEYFIQIALAAGFVVTVTEPHPHTVDDDVDLPVYDAPWRFAWYINAPAVTVRVFAVDDTVDDPLAIWGNAPLECVIRRYKPAHTQVLFAYA